MVAVHLCHLLCGMSRAPAAPITGVDPCCALDGDDTCPGIHFKLNPPLPLNHDVPDWHPERIIDSPNLRRRLE